MKRRINFWRAPLVVGGLGWAWQAVAYLVLVPRSGLQYGWFKTTAGKLPGLVILDLPFYAVLAVVVAACILGTLRLWRDHRRLATLGLWAWGAVVFLVFAIPSLLIDFQGNASIFI